MFNFSRNCLFQSSSIILCPYPQCMRSPLSSHLHQQLLLSVFFIIPILVSVKWYLIVTFSFPWWLVILDSFYMTSGFKPADSLMLRVSLKHLFFNSKMFSLHLPIEFSSTLVPCCLLPSSVPYAQLFQT